MKKIILLTASMLTWSVAWAEPDTYRIDPSHSFANWSIRHVASKTSGTFNDITGQILIDLPPVRKRSRSMAAPRPSRPPHLHSVFSPAPHRSRHTPSRRWREAGSTPRGCSLQRERGVPCR